MWGSFFIVYLKGGSIYKYITYDNSTRIRNN